jgi:hypothetical protein
LNQLVCNLFCSLTVCVFISNYQYEIAVHNNASRVVPRDGCNGPCSRDEFVNCVIYIFKLSEIWLVTDIVAPGFPPLCSSVLVYLFFCWRKARL